MITKLLSYEAEAEVRGFTRAVRYDGRALELTICGLTLDQAHDVLRHLSLGTLRAAELPVPRAVERYDVENAVREVAGPVPAPASVTSTIRDAAVQDAMAAIAPPVIPPAAGPVPAVAPNDAVAAHAARQARAKPRRKRGADPEAPLPGQGGLPGTGVPDTPPLTASQEVGFDHDGAVKEIAESLVTAGAPGVRVPSPPASPASNPAPPPAAPAADDPEAQFGAPGLPDPADYAAVRAADLAGQLPTPKNGSAAFDPAKATSFASILEDMIRRGHATVPELVAECQRVRADVPLIRVVNNLEDRVKRTYEILRTRGLVP